MLVMGGSQGASGINQAIVRLLPLLRNVSLQVIHLSGTRDERMLADNYRRAKLPAFVAAFHHRMEELYSAADFAVPAAGADCGVCSGTGDAEAHGAGVGSGPARDR